MKYHHIPTGMVSIKGKKKGERKKKKQQQKQRLVRMKRNCNPCALLAGV